ncbi:MAG TPA: TonB-dependent receptor, partial [Gemmatimonadales bacterium]|nr:TonB-dependent receptor [Gemmatimonadales bacterium]
MTKMFLSLATLCACATFSLPAQQTDTLHVHGDSLNHHPITLEAITVTAAPEKRDEPASTVKIRPAAILQTPATDAYDLLRQLGGIDVHEQGQGPGFASDASVRGFSSDHSTDIALWVDGVPNNEPINGHAEGYNDWNLLFPEAISGIDILKGPTNATYGNFAFSGVVNVQTLERTNATSLWLSPGSYGRFDGGFLTGYDHGTNGAVFGIRGVREDGWRPNSGYDVGQVHARIVQGLSTSTTLDAGFEYYTTHWRSPGFLSDSAFDAGLFGSVANPTDDGNKDRAQERVSLRVLGSSSLLWRTTLYSTQGHFHWFLTTPPEGSVGEGSGSQTEEADLRYGFGLISALTWYLPRAEITVGTEEGYAHSRFSNWFTTNRVEDSAQVLATAHQSSAALFLQSTEDIGYHFRLNLGGRVDFQNNESTPFGGTSVSRGKSIFSPKVGLLYHLPVAADLYANVSRGFRQTDGVIEDPTLPFITVWDYEAGVKVDTRTVSGSIAFFQMDVSNEQTFNPITLTDVSGGTSRRKGVEADFLVQLAPALRLTGDWTFTDAKYQQLITEAGDTLSGARVFNTAKYTGVAALELAPETAPWRLQVSTNVLGPYSPFDEPGVERPAYGLLHVSGGWRVGDAEI